MIDAEDVKAVAGLVKSGLLGSFAAAVGHLVEVVHKDLPFRWLAFIVFVLAGFMLGEALNHILPETWPGRGGLIGLTCTGAYKVIFELQDGIGTVAKKVMDGLGELVQRAVQALKDRIGSAIAQPRKDEERE